MLTIKAPIQLHITQSLTGNADAFGQRIRGNYSLMGANFGAKDLLFLLSAPPELPDDLGGMTTLVNQQSNVNVRSVTMDVVNNVVNRILLDGTEQFTYQDQVYLTTVLNRLGITNAQTFLDQVRQLRLENESTVHLTRLYRAELAHILQRQAAGEPVPALPLPAPAGEEEPSRPQDPRVTLCLDILNRLDAANTFQTLHAFQRSWSGGENVFRNQELRLSEQLRVQNVLALTQVQQRLYEQPDLHLTYHQNAYETGAVPEVPTDEEQVLSQAAAAALVSAVDHTVVQVLNRPELRREQWVQIQNALWQTAETTLARFESYHSQPQPPDNLTRRTEETWNRYVQELQHYETLRQSIYPRAAEQVRLPGGRTVESHTRLTHRTAETEREEVLRDHADTVHTQERRTDTLERTRAELLRQILQEQGGEREVPLAAPPPAGEVLQPIFHQETRQEGDRSFAQQNTQLVYHTTGEGTEGEEAQPPARREISLAPDEDTPVLTPQQREQQAQALRETILRQLQPGSVPPVSPARPPVTTVFPAPPEERGEEPEPVPSAHTRETVVRETYRERERRREIAQRTLREVLERAAARPGSVPPPETTWSLTQDRRSTTTQLVHPAVRETQTVETEQTRLEALVRDVERQRLWTEKPSVRTTLLHREHRDLERERVTSTTRVEGMPPTGGVSEPRPLSAPDLLRRAEPVPPPPPAAPLPLTPREAEEQAPETLMEELRRIDQHNRTVLQTLQAQDRPKGTPVPTGPDLPRTMREALRALDQPEQVLREWAARREAPESPAPLALTPREEALLEQASPEERAVYQAVLAYQKNPEQAIAQGLLRPGTLGNLHGAIQQAAQDSEPLELAHPGPEAQAQQEQLREQAEAVLERFQHHTPAPRRVETESAPPPAVKIVHKQAPPDVTEELLEQLNQQRTQTTLRNENREEVTRSQSHQVEVHQVEKKVVAQTTEDITELVNRTLARQMRSISDQVYRQMEKRLQTERSRRGRW